MQRLPVRFDAETRSVWSRLSAHMPRGTFVLHSIGCFLTRQRAATHFFNEGGHGSPNPQMKGTEREREE